jgi:hypothetical protein
MKESLLISMAMYWMNSVYEFVANFSMELSILCTVNHQEKGSFNTYVRLHIIHT